MFVIGLASECPMCPTARRANTPMTTKTSNLQPRLKLILQELLGPMVNLRAVSIVCHKSASPPTNWLNGWLPLSTMECGCVKSHGYNVHADNFRISLVIVGLNREIKILLK